MFCEKCGTKNDSSNKFCEKCGNKLEPEVKETKKTVKKENTSSVKDKLNTLSKKQKIIGGVVGLVVIILIVLYAIGSKMTSLETIGSKAFEELASKSKISNKYLSVPLDSKDYFISLADTMKNEIKDEDIALTAKTIEKFAKNILDYKEKEKNNV